MSLRHSVIKPRSQRGKRFVKNREPKLFENTKTSLAIRTNTANQTIINVLKDLSALKKPDSAFLGRKHDIRPFENEQLLESLSSKYDASLLLLGSDNKKRRSCLTFARTYDHHILDMFEFCVENFRGIRDFPGMAPPLGNKPLLIFRGETFEHDATYQKIKSMFFDYFRGPDIEKIRPSGISHCITFTSVEGKILMRTFMLNGPEEGGELAESNISESTLTLIGPSMDLVPKRSKIPSDDLWKVACRVPREATIKKTKNVSKDVFGSKLGRIHMDTQDFSKLVTKKMKGLKKDIKNTEGDSQTMEVDSAVAVGEFADIGGDVD